MLLPKTVLCGYGLRAVLPFVGLLAGSVISAPAQAAGLNDTGQITCYDDTQAVVPEPSTHPRQDCTMGRDAAAAAGVLPKVGGGSKGFDYTKIANDGRELPADAVLGSRASDWACTRDNLTGRIWEVKTDDGGLRDKDWGYTWYDDIHTDNNGGVPGSLGTDTCGGTLPNSQCNTQAYVVAVNAAGLCGFSDWRLPTKRELHQLVDLGIPSPGPTIDVTYFSHTVASSYWSSSTYTSTDFAEGVDFDNGYVHYGRKVDLYGLPTIFTNLVRLARGGQ